VKKPTLITTLQTPKTLPNYLCKPPAKTTCTGCRDVSPKYKYAKVPSIVMAKFKYVRAKTYTGIQWGWPSQAALGQINFKWLDLTPPTFSNFPPLSKL
jgi:hypothetical protein